MAQGFFDIDLSTTAFPMLAEQQGRTYISSRQPNEQPQVAYCHNVMPTEYGYRAIGYTTVVGATTNLPAGVEMQDVRVVYSKDKERVTLGWSTTGRLFALLPYVLDLYHWEEVTIQPAPGVLTPLPYNPANVTSGTVNGSSYIYYKQYSAYRLNLTDMLLEPVELIGLEPETILGITSSVGYLVAYTAIAIAWSSTIDPLDFVPSQVTGAGGGNIADIAGDISFVTSNSLGLLIYSKSNIVAGTYTGNARYPFKLREVDDSKGVVNVELVTSEANSSAHYAITEANIVAVTSQKTESILPEVSDFISGRRFEDYNEVTDTYVRTYISAQKSIKTKIKFIAARYLIVSYALPDSEHFTHAFIYDKTAQKVGKLKFDHVDVFEYIAPESQPYAGVISLVNKLGQVVLADTNANLGAGVLVLGKISFSASRTITLLGVEINNVTVGANVQVLSQASLDGLNFAVVQGVPSYNGGRIKEYVFKSTAQHHSIVVKGTFDLASCHLRYTINGRR